MKLSKTKRIHSIGFNMTPMIDIVFLLIIFFMTVSQITRVSEHAVDLPSVSDGVTPSISSTLSINLDEKGGIFVSGEQVSVDRTMAIVKQRIADLGGEPSQVKIRLRADRDCPSGFANRVVRQLAKLGVSQIQVATVGEGTHE